MKRLSRREAMGTIITAGAGVTLAGMTQAAAQTTVAPAFRGQHQIKPLPFDAAKLKGISEKLIKSHWENNYSGAVKALNAVEQRLAAMLSDKTCPRTFTATSNAKSWYAPARSCCTSIISPISAATVRLVVKRWQPSNSTGAATRSGRRNSREPATRWAAGRAG